jgi:hypothetical protein
LQAQQHWQQQVTAAHTTAQQLHQLRNCLRSQQQPQQVLPAPLPLGPQMPTGFKQLTRKQQTRLLLT